MTVLDLSISRIEYINWRKSLGLINKSKNFFNAEGFRTYLIYAILLCVQPYPFLKDITTEIDFDGGEVVVTKINYIFLIFYFPIRLYFIAEYFVINCYYYSPRAERICRVYSTDISFSLAVRLLIKKDPIFIILPLLIANCFLGGYLIRIVERQNNVLPLYAYDNFLIAVWYSFITMTTVGYGEYSAKGYIGRILTLLISINGIFIISIVTVVLTNFFEFEGGQLKAFSLLRQIKIRESLSDCVKGLLKSSGLILILNKRIKRSEDKHNILIMQKKLDWYVTTRENLRTQAKELKDLFENTADVDYIENIIDQLSSLKKEVEKITYSVNNMAEVIADVKENHSKIQYLNK